MSLSFASASSEYLVLVNPVGALDISGTALTVSVWVRPDAVNGARMVVSKASSGSTSTQYALFVQDGVLVMRIGDAAGVDDASGGSVSTGVWTHLCGVKSGTGAGALRAYVNGSSVGTGTSNRSIQDTAQNFVIGSRHTGDLRWDGRIAVVALWNVALSAEEIAALAKGANPLRVRPQNLAAYYPLWTDSNVAYPHPDFSGNAQHLGQSGTPELADHAPVGPYVLL
jgi:hypothetical protein